MLKTLEVDAALRYDHYNVPNANTWNPKLGVKWTPIQQLALRGTAGTGFRAPWIAEAGNAGALFNSPRRGTRCCAPTAFPTAGPIPFHRTTLPGRSIIAASTWPFCSASNPNLEPEKSTNYTAGFVVEPIRGWSTTFDYYYIKLKNQIVTSAAWPAPLRLRPCRSGDPADRDLRGRSRRTFPGRSRRVLQVAVCQREPDDD